MIKYHTWGDIPKWIGHCTDTCDASWLINSLYISISPIKGLKLTSKNTLLKELSRSIMATLCRKAIPFSILNSQYLWPQMITTFSFFYCRVLIVFRYRSRSQISVLYKRGLLVICPYLTNISTLFQIEN